MDRPPLNILDLDLLAQLGNAVEELEQLGDLQLVVVRGAGERAFSAGVSVDDHTPERVPEMLRRFHGPLLRLRQLPAVSLAVVHGHCLGGGMELAAACDLVLAADDASFGQPEIKLGCYPPLAAALYPGRIGRARTLELLLSGRTLSCDEAEQLGLVTWRVPAARLETEADALAKKILSSPAAVTRILKRAVDAGCRGPFAEALAESEHLYLEELTQTRDMREGLAAFLEKRQPRWTHE